MGLGTQEIEDGAMIKGKLCSHVFAALVALFLLGTPHLAQALDQTARIALITAFDPEFDVLRSRIQATSVWNIKGVEIVLGKLGGKDVVLMKTGISMVNAAMHTQLLLDHVDVRAIVVSGIAGGVDPGLHIGDVAIPERWGEYLESVFAREDPTGKFLLPSWAGKAFDNYGMIFPQPVHVIGPTTGGEAEKFWFAADPKLLALASHLPGEVALSHCADAGSCLGAAPRVVVGGSGVSGQAFLDNGAFRGYVFATFHAEAVDMETAAIAAVAFSNGVPFIAVRSLSDLAGGESDANAMGVFFKVAAENAARTVEKLVAAIPADK
jgi:adenosylhomocysteine nucleosidase